MISQSLSCDLIMQNPLLCFRASFSCIIKLLVLNLIIARSLILLFTHFTTAAIIIVVFIIIIIIVVIRGRRLIANQMKWVVQMNNIRSRAAEIVNNDLIYT